MADEYAKVRVQEHVAHDYIARYIGTCGTVLYLGIQEFAGQDYAKVLVY